MGFPQHRSWAAVCAALFLASACQAGPSPSPTATPSARPSATPAATESGPPPITEIGPGEGALSLIVRPGYAERGANDSAYDWLTEFETKSACRVTAVEAGTSEQILAKAEEGEEVWDGVASPGDVAGRLIDERRVQPLDPASLFESWSNVWPPLQGATYDTAHGVHYGVAQGWSPNLLTWNTTIVQPDPTSWGVLYDQGSPYAGRITAHDSALSIADAALYLSRARPELRITDPYELTNEQFDAAVDLLKAQRRLVGIYWGTPLDEINAFTDATAVLGTAWPAQLRVLQTTEPPVPVKAALPAEGATGWADSWMLLDGARHPNCMLRWMAWMLEPAVQKQVAEYAALAPANVRACRLLDREPGPFGFAGFCAFYHAQDDAFAQQVRFWKTPLADCGDERGRVCVDYGTWLQQWDEVKAAG